MAGRAKRRAIVGIMGSGAEDGDFTRAAEAGRLVAELGYHLLTGAGEGAMAAASRAFVGVTGRTGLAIGIVPARDQQTPTPPKGYPNPFIELPIFTNLVREGGPDDPGTRNHINILTAHALIFCPGSKGTRCELALARRYDKPHILFLGGDGTIDGEGAAALEALAPAADNLDALRNFLIRTLGA